MGAKAKEVRQKFRMQNGERRMLRHGEDARGSGDERDSYAALVLVRPVLASVKGRFCALALR